MLHPLDDLTSRADRQSGAQNELSKQQQNFSKLLTALEQKPLTDADEEFVNSHVKKLNALSDNDKAWLKKAKSGQKDILTYFEKTHQWVAINHHRNVWLAVGIGAFGVPMGVAFSMIIHNMAFIGLGIPIGLAMGLVIGTGLDKQAKEKNRQLNFEPQF